MKNEEISLAKEISKPLAFGIAGVAVVIVCALGYYLTNRDVVPPAPPMITGTTMPEEMKNRQNGMPPGMPGAPPGMSGMPGAPPGMQGMQAGMPGGGPPAISGSVGGQGPGIPVGPPAHKPDKPGDAPPPPAGAPQGMVGQRVDPSTLKIPGH